MPPIIIGAAIAGVASLASSAIGANASREGADRMSDAANRAADLQEKRYQQTRQDLNPWVQSGNKANDRLVNMSGLGDKPFSYSPSDPSYAWRLQQGTGAVNSSAAARGGYFSGATGQALQQEGQQLASTEYGNDWDRMYRMSGMGESAAAQVGQFGASAANNQGQDLMAAGNAQAAGIQGNANAWGQGLGAVGGFAQGAGNYLQYQNDMNNQWFGNQSGYDPSKLGPGF
jgi:hypothetical protein